eukprot:superscaffoldBa00000388_g4311
MVEPHNLLDSKINTVLSMCQDTNLLNPVHGIVQSVVYHEESPPQYQPSYLQIYHFMKSLFNLQQTQIPDYAELIVKFLEALIDSYLPAADEERGEEQLRTPTSPYPPTSQSQLSITANLNLSNSMTSLATSQHSPGVDKENVQLSPSSALSSSGRTRHGSASQVQKQRSAACQTRKQFQPARPGNNPQVVRPGNNAQAVRPGNKQQPSNSGNNQQSSNPGNNQQPSNPGNNQKPGKPGNSQQPGNPGNNQQPGNPGNSQ